MEQKSKFQQQYDFSRKGTKYKTKYFDNLKLLFGKIEHEREIKEELNADGSQRTDTLCKLVEKAGG